MIAPATAPPRPPSAPPMRPPTAPPKIPPATGSCAAAGCSGIAQATVSSVAVANVRNMDRALVSVKPLGERMPLAATCVNPVAASPPNLPDVDGVRPPRGAAARENDFDRGRVGSRVAALGDIHRARAGYLFLVAGVALVLFRKRGEIARLRNGDAAVLRLLRQPHHGFPDAAA